MRSSGYHASTMAGNAKKEKDAHWRTADSEVNQIIFMTTSTEDMKTLQEWAQTWQMQFNTQKCKVMRIGSGEK